MPGPQSDPNLGEALFDIAADPGKTKNLATTNPERVAAMRAHLVKLVADGRSTPGAPQKNDVPVELTPSAQNADGQAKPQKRKSSPRTTWATFCAMPGR